MSTIFLAVAEIAELPDTSADQLKGRCMLLYFHFLLLRCWMSSGPRRSKRRKTDETNMPETGAHVNTEPIQEPSQPTAQPTTITSLISAIDTGDEMEKVIALQELSHFLLFNRITSVNQVCKTLVMSLGSPMPDVILLACRCIANLLEALADSVVQILRNGAVSKLIKILQNAEWIDLAEQVLIVLEKISLDYPTSVIKENGLEAILRYIDFFSSHTARIAVKTVANSCQSLPKLSPYNDRAKSAHLGIQAVMSTLVTLVGSQDQKTSESATISLFRIVKWASQDVKKLEDIIIDHMQTIVRAYANFIANPTAANPKSLSQMNQILTCIAAKSPVCGSILINSYDMLDIVKDHITVGDSVAKFTQTPVENILEVLELICRCLPPIPPEGVWCISNTPLEPHSVSQPVDQTLKILLKTTFPVLIDVFENTVNLTVRIKATECICKYLHFANVLNPPPSQKTLFSFIVHLVRFQELSIVNEKQYPHEMQQRLTLTLLGLCLATILVKAEPSYQATLARQGLLEQLEKIVAKEPEFTELFKSHSPEKSEMGADDSENSELDSMRRLMSFMSNRPVSGTLHSDIQFITKERFTGAKGIQKAFQLANELKSGILTQNFDRMLNEIVASVNSKANAQQLARGLSQLSVYLVENAGDLTEFEISSSGLAQMLVAFMMHGSEIHPTSEWDVTWKERMEIFLQCFAAFESRSAFLILVNGLLERISAAERFEVLTISNAMFHSKTSREAQFARQLRIHLIADDDEKFVPIQVCIQAIAAFDAFSAFVSSRLKDPTSILNPMDSEDEDGDGDLTIIPTQSDPQDLVFAIDGVPCSSDTTIFSAIYKSSKNIPLNDMFAKTHKIHFSKADSARSDDESMVSKNIDQVCKNPILADIDISSASIPAIGESLILVRLLYNFNQIHSIIPNSHFLNSKLTAKVTRQLDELIIVVSNVLPAWCEMLIRAYGFFLPFETRVNFFKMTSLGYSRSLGHFQPKLRMSRTKIQVDRDNIKKGIETVLNSNPNSRLEVAFVDEVGTGLGPTLEFFSISSEYFKSMAALWRSGPTLYPYPHSEVQLFEIIGAFSALALRDGRTMDLVFHELFMEQVFSRKKCSHQLAAVIILFDTVDRLCACRFHREASPL